MNANECKYGLWAEALKNCGSGTVTVAGSSMLPVLAIGDKVHIELCPPASYRTGDIVVFKGSTSLVIHRIVATVPGMKGKLFVHKGDNGHLLRFGLIKPEQILGRAVKVENGAGEIAVSALPKRRAITLFGPLYCLLAVERYVAISLKRWLVALNRRK